MKEKMFVMRNRKQFLLTVTSSLIIFSMMASVFFVRLGPGAHAAAKTPAYLDHLNAAGTSKMKPVNRADGGTIRAGSPPIYPAKAGAIKLQMQARATIKVAPTAQGAAQGALAPPNPAGLTVTTNNPNFSGFNGMTNLDQRSAGTGIYAGSQFSVEPPDQGFCVGNGFVLQNLNDAVAVYSASSDARVSGPTATNQFFNLAPVYVNSNPPVFGDFTTDPRCYYDPGVQRWFLTLLQINVVPATGAFGTRSHILIAVSQSSDPTASWSLFSLDVTDDGSNYTVTHAFCPCRGDEPLIGADANGIYISINQYDIATFSHFEGAQIFAISKSALVAAATASSAALPPVVQIDTNMLLLPYGGLSYSIQPAISPSSDQWDSRNQGTEYFLSALDFTGTLDNRIAEWALINTSSLNSSTPDVNLSFIVVNSEVYGQPPNATQKPGPTPLGTSVGEGLEQILSGDDRMQQVVYAYNQLWSGLNTIVQAPGGTAYVGIAYFCVQPSWQAANLQATILNQGYVSVTGDNVMFPAIGVTRDGKAVMSFTLVGPDYFPSAAYTPIQSTGPGNVHIAGAGAAPEDGFYGYKAFGGNGISDWGGFSTAVSDANGMIWTSTEYIPNLPRYPTANWGTFISSVNPSTFP